MRKLDSFFWVLPIALGSFACGASGEPALEESSDDLANSAGRSATHSALGAIDRNNPFFAKLGTNQRTCETCHMPAEGWSVAVEKVRSRFENTQGRNPLFRLVDGATSPNADVSTLEARRSAYSLLLKRGLFRVGMGVPENAEFEVIAIDDPYKYATTDELSLFRRPLPSANLAFATGVMWDGRESVPEGVHQGLLNQSNGATLGHAEAKQPIDLVTRAKIVGFESSLFNTQVIDRSAGNLNVCGAKGDAETLAGQPVVQGPFDIFAAWNNLNKSCGSGARGEARRAIARGQALFNTRMNPRGSTCNGCHSAQNAGTNIEGKFFAVGVSAGSRRQPDMPLYTLKNITTGELRTSTDPGRALVTGLWSDVDRFKTPTLRALAARAPYFHNGFAATLPDVVRLYEESLGFDFTPAEEADLVAFLTAL